MYHVTKDPEINLCTLTLIHVQPKSEILLSFQCVSADLCLCVRICVILLHLRHNASLI